MIQVKDEWINKLRNPLDEDKARKGIEWLYSLAGLDKPEVIFCRSPFAIQILANILKSDSINDSVCESVRESVNDLVCESVRESVRNSVLNSVIKSVNNSVYDSVYDSVCESVGKSVRNFKLEFEPFAYSGTSYDFYWVAFYDFFQRIGILENDGLKKLIELSDSGIFMSVQFKGLCIVCENPKYIKRNNQGQMHCDDGYSIEWADGYGLYYMNGTEVPDYIATTKKEDLDLEKVLLEKNADVRLEGMRKLGPERLAEKGKLIDTYKNYEGDDFYWWNASEYELYDLNNLHEGLGIWLKMKHMTLMSYCVERVGSDNKNIREALMYRTGEDPFNYITMNMK